MRWGSSKLEQPDFTASTRAGSPALIVVSEQAIPEAYWLPQPPKLDRQGLLGELKRGAAIPGAGAQQPEAGTYGEDKVMAFTDSQVRQLKAKLDPRYIKTRSANGVHLSYVEGWHAIAEANRIFGFDAWDRRTVSTACVWSGQTGRFTPLPTSPKCGSACAPQIPPLCVKAQEPGKAELQPRGKHMN